MAEFPISDGHEWYELLRNVAMIPDEVASLEYPPQHLDLADFVRRVDEAGDELRCNVEMIQGLLSARDQAVAILNADEG